MTAYSKCPSIGLRYHTLDLTQKRFQVSFINSHEHASCLHYLQSECNIAISDSPSASKPPHLRTISTTSSSQPLNFLPDSQFIIPMAPVQQHTFAQPQPQPQHHQFATLPGQFPNFPLSQPTASQPTLSQTMTPQVLANTTTSTAFDMSQLDYLSQILDPVRETESFTQKPENNRGHITMEDLDAMTDAEINELLKEKIKDINFINFVERIESCLKTIQD